MDSANRRPRTPEVCSPKANVPAKGPKPTAISSSAAHTSSGVLRKALSSSRVAARQCAGSCAWALLAGSASARPSSTANKVPNADMARVSSEAISTLLMKTVPISGCKSSPKKRPILAAASHDQNCAHCKFNVAKLATTSSTTPSISQKALQRASNSLGGNL